MQTWHVILFNITASGRYITWQINLKKKTIQNHSTDVKIQPQAGPKFLHQAYHILYRHKQSLKVHGKVQKKTAKLLNLKQRNSEFSNMLLSFGPEILLLTGFCRHVISFSITQSILLILCLNILKFDKKETKNMEQFFF